MLISNTRQRRTLEPPLHGLLRIVAVRPPLRDGVAPLIRAPGERAALDLGAHGPVPRLLLRAVGKVPDETVDHAGLLHRAAALDALLLEPAERQRQVPERRRLVERDRQRRPVLHRHRRPLRHVRHHGVRGVAQDDEPRPAADPGPELPAVCEWPLDAGCDERDDLGEPVSAG